MIPDPRIIENIKKLKNLGMSDKEIKENLLKMGLSEKDCDDLLNSEEKKEPLDQNRSGEISVSKPEEKMTVASAFKKEEIPSDFFNSDSDEITDLKTGVKELSDEVKEEENKKEEELPDITKGLDLNTQNRKEEELPDITKGLDLNTQNRKEEELPDITKGLDLNIQNRKEVSSKDIYDNEKIEELNYKIPKPTIAPIEIKENQNIWETGLATTINTKLSEIESKQEKIEEYLKSKIDQELIKYKKIQETNKQLLISKVTDMVSQQEQAVNVQITKQLAMIKIEQAKLNKKIEEINSGKSELQKTINNVNELSEQLEENSKIIQDNINKLSITTTTKLNLKLKEINDILALQSRITQGLIKNTQIAINNEVRKLNEFKEKISSEINPEELYDKLSELEAFKQKLANRYEDRFEMVKREFLVKAREAYKNDIDKQFLELNNLKNTIVSKTDPEIITKKIEELTDFKKTLLESIDEKISGALNIYESAITQEIKGKIRTVDEVTEKVESEIKKIQIAQDKINEIDKFKEQFIAVIDKNIEKMNKTMKLIENKIKDLEKEKNTFDNIKA